MGFSLKYESIEPNRGQDKSKIGLWQDQERASRPLIPEKRQKKLRQQPGFINRGPRGKIEPGLKIKKPSPLREKAFR
jgi:hypothetical protein